MNSDVIPTSFWGTQPYFVENPFTGAFSELVLLCAAVAGHARYLHLYLVRCSRTHFLSLVALDLFVTSMGCLVGGLPARTLVITYIFFELETSQCLATGGVVGAFWQHLPMRLVYIRWLD